MFLARVFFSSFFSSLFALMLLAFAAFFLEDDEAFFASMLDCFAACFCFLTFLLEAFLAETDDSCAASFLASGVLALVKLKRTVETIKVSHRYCVIFFQLCFV